MNEILTSLSNRSDGFVNKCLSTGQNFEPWEPSQEYLRLQELLRLRSQDNEFALAGILMTVEAFPEVKLAFGERVRTYDPTGISPAPITVTAEQTAEEGIRVAGATPPEANRILRPTPYLNAGRRTYSTNGLDNAEDVYPFALLAWDAGGSRWFYAYTVDVSGVGDKVWISGDSAVNPLNVTSWTAVPGTTGTINLLPATLPAPVITTSLIADQHGPARVIRKASEWPVEHDIQFLNLGNNQGLVYTSGQKEVVPTTQYDNFICPMWPEWSGISGKIKSSVTDWTDFRCTISHNPVNFPHSAIVEQLDVSADLRNILSREGLEVPYYYAGSDAEKVAVAALAFGLTNKKVYPDA